MVDTSRWDPTLPERARAAVQIASKEGKEAAIIHATQFIDTLPFKGERLHANQALAWPRKSVLGNDGAPVIGVPEEIKEATSLVAGFILAKIPFDVPAVAWVMLKLGHLLQDDIDLMKHDVTWH